MFKSYAAKEVLYIFLWLIGIIFVYTLVHTFLLEPSKNNTHVTTHVASETSIKHSATPIKTKAAPHIKTKKENVLKTPQIAAPIPVPQSPVTSKEIQSIHQSIPEAKKEASLKVNHKKVSEPNDTSLLQIKTEDMPKVTQVPSVKKPINSVKIPKPKNAPIMTKIQKITKPEIPKHIITAPSVVSVPSIPSTPSVPTVPSIPNTEQPILPETIINIESKTVKIEEVLIEEINRDEKMKLIETARKHVIEQAEATRKKAMDALSR